MRPISPRESRALRAKAHHLRPCVSVGQHGLTSAVVHEIDVALKAHELVKIRVFSDDRSERESLLARICNELDAAPVQHLGKLLIVWRPAPEPQAVEPARAARRNARPEAIATHGKKPRAGPRKEQLPEIPASRRRKPTPRAPVPMASGDEGGARRRRAVTAPADRRGAASSKSQPARRGLASATGKAPARRPPR